MIEQIATVFASVGLHTEVVGDKIHIKRSDVSQSLMKFFFFLLPDAMEILSKEFGLLIRSADNATYTFMILKENEKICSIECC